MRIITWNIRHGGGKRLEAICKALTSKTPDIVVITEFRNGETGKSLQSYFEESGLTHLHAGKTAPRQNSTLIASRHPFLKTGFVARAVEHPFRMPYVQMKDLTVAGAYLPILRQKHPYWERLVPWSQKRRRSPLLVTGDFNTGRHFLDETGASYISSHYMDAMEKAGFDDLWRSAHPNAREFTWYSHRQNGFRLDHMFGTEAIQQQVTSIRYDHRVRDQNVSDHSMMIVDLDL